MDGRNPDEKDEESSSSKVGGEAGSLGAPAKKVVAQAGAVRTPKKPDALLAAAQGVAGAMNDMAKMADPEQAAPLPSPPPSPEHSAASVGSARQEVSMPSGSLSAPEKPTPSKSANPEQQKRDMERQRWVAIYNKANKIDWGYRRVDKLGVDEQGNPIQSIAPAISTDVGSVFKPFAPGVYSRKAPLSKYDFRIDDRGYVTPLLGNKGLMSVGNNKVLMIEEIESVKTGLRWGGYLLALGASSVIPVLPLLLSRPLYSGIVSDWNTKYGKTIDFLVNSTGTKTLVLDWPDKKFVTGHYIEKMMKLASEKGMVVEFGPNVQAYLDKHPVLRRKFADMQEQQSIKQKEMIASAENAPAAVRDDGIEHNRKYSAFKDKLDAREKLGNDGDAKAKAIAAFDKDPKKAFQALSERANEVCSIKDSVTSHINSLSKANIPADALQSYATDAAIPPLLNSVKSELQDIQARSALLKQHINAHPANAGALSDAQKKVFVELEKIESKAGTYEKGQAGSVTRADVVGIDSLLEKVKGLETRVGSLKQSESQQQDYRQGHLSQ